MSRPPTAKRWLDGKGGEAVWSPTRNGFGELLYRLHPTEKWRQPGERTLTEAKAFLGQSAFEHPFKLARFVPPVKDEFKIIFAGGLQRVAAAKGEGIKALDRANIIEIGEDAIADVCPFGAVVFLGPNEEFYELGYTVFLKKIHPTEVMAQATAQICFPHKKEFCTRCPKGDVDP